MGKLTVDLGKPQPKQVEFLESREKYVCYGGARSGGKSWVLRYAAKLYGLKYPGIKQLIVRRAYPELKENHIIPLREETVGICTYNEQEKSMRFPLGSRVKFTYCANTGDELNFNGQEWDIIYIDEAQQLTESAFNAIKATLRGVNRFPKRMFIFCNPGGVGMTWIRRLFIERNFTGDENPDDYRFIQALVTDNKALMESNPDYIKQLESLPPAMKAAWRYGDWYSFEGRFFGEFRADIHVVEPFPIPEHWRRYRAIDYGLDMLAVLWIAVSDTGEQYVYRELHKPNMIASAAAEEICRLSEGEDIYDTFAPPDLWHRSQDTGKTIAELFENGGVRFTRCNAERVGGWQAVKELIKPINGMYGVETSRLRIFRSCVTLIKHMQVLEFSERNPSDAATEPHEYTHICDALRYFAAMHTYAPKVDKISTEAEKLSKMKENAIRKCKTNRKRW